MDKTSMKPSTPLDNERVDELDRLVGYAAAADDAQFLEDSAREERDRRAAAYPQLIAALREYHAAARGGDWGKAIEGGDALLRSIGEAQ